MAQLLVFEDVELTPAQLGAAADQLAAGDLIARLQDGRGIVRANALRGLAAIGHAGPEVLLFLRDADVRVARAAADALLQLGRRGLAQVPHFVAIAAAAAEARPEIAAAVAEMFAALVGKADAALVAVLDIAESNVADLVITAAALTSLQGLRLLHAAARDRRTLVRLHAVRGIALLGAIEPASSFEVLHLVERTDEVSDVRAATRTALAALKQRLIATEAAERKTGELAPPLVPNVEQRALTAPELKTAATVAPREELLRLMQSPSSQARLNAVRIIALLHDVGRETVNALGERLRDPDVAVRREVARVLGAIDGNASAAIPALVGALADTDADVGSAAEAALVALGDAAAPALVDGLDTPSDRVGARVAALIGRLDDGPRRLAAALALTAGDARIHAARGLAALGRPRAVVALPALAAASAHANAHNARLRAALAEALAVVAPRPDRAPPAIAITGFETRVLTDAELGAARPELAAVGVAGLAAHLNDPRVALRTNVVAALGTLPGAALDSAALLAVALRDDAGSVRLAAVHALDRLGDPAVVAVADALVRALGDDALVEPVAAILRTRSHATLDDALARGLAIPDTTHAQRICELIVARPGGPALLAAAFEQSTTQANAARGLALLGPARIGAGRAVLEAARAHPSAQTRQRAAATLLALDGLPSTPTAPAVAGFDSTLLAATAFTGALSASQLMPFLQDGRPIVRANAVTALGTLGAPGAAHLAITIAALLRDDDEQVRIAAAHTLDRLGDDVVVATASSLVAAMRGPVAVHAACKTVLAARGAKVETALLAGLEAEDETHGMRVAELVCALPNAPQLLFAAFDGEAQNVQVNAALGIGLLGSKRAGAGGRARLRNGLAGPITRRRHAIVKALALLGPAE